jgi:hypothetical protein
MEYKYPDIGKIRKTCEIDRLLWFKMKMICTYQKESSNNFLNAALFKFIAEHEEYYDKNYPKRSIALKAAVEAYKVENEE